MREELGMNSTNFCGYVYEIQSPDGRQRLSCALPASTTQNRIRKYPKWFVRFVAGFQLCMAVAIASHFPKIGFDEPVFLLVILFFFAVTIIRLITGDFLE